MAAADWSVVTGALSSGDCARGVTTGTTKPDGGGTFAYVLHSLSNAPGVVALYTTQVNFAPMTKGCDISAAMCRFTSAGAIDFSCFIFASLGGNSASDNCYMLGLSDGDPSHIELRKGALAVGLPDEAPLGANKILRRSTETVDIDVWKHLRLEVVTQPFGDVILNCYKNDLPSNGVLAPVWTAIAGMDPFTDDFAGINTGSAPYAAGRAGFGGRVDDIARRCGFDHIRVARQTVP